MTEITEVIDYTERKLIRMIEDCFYEEDRYCLLTILEMYKREEETVQWMGGMPVVDPILTPSAEAI